MTFHITRRAMALSVLGCVSFVEAGTSSCSCHLQTKVSSSLERSQDGLRFGAGIAGEYTFTNTADKTDPLITSVKRIGDPTDNETAFECAPHIEIGYRFHNGCYLGLVASYHYSPNHMKFNHIIGEDFGKPDDIRHKVITGTRQYSFSTLVKLGYHVQPSCMLYGLLGAQFTKWKRKESIFVNDVFQTSQNYQYSSTGLTYGAGLEWQMTRNLSLSTDWTHTIYSKDKKSFSSVLGVRQNSHALSVKISYFL